MGDRACAVLVQRGRILLVRQRYRGSLIWTFPGGGIEPGETPETAAIREVREEVGLDIAIDCPLRQCPRTGVEGTYYCFLGRIVGGRVALGTDPEHPADAVESARLMVARHCNGRATDTGPRRHTINLVHPANNRR